MVAVVPVPVPVVRDPEGDGLVVARTPPGRGCTELLSQSDTRSGSHDRERTTGLPPSAVAGPHRAAVVVDERKSGRQIVAGLAERRNSRPGAAEDLLGRGDDAGRVILDRHAHWVTPFSRSIGGDVYT